MAHVIAEPCIGVKDTACVDVCPVDVIHPGKEEAGYAAANQLYVFPDDCIDCGACIPACPVSAIYAEEDLPEKWQHFAQINAGWYARNRETEDAVATVTR
ncbi:MAG: ferredoxin family protein [Bryobacteraceae bacterium]